MSRINATTDDVAAARQAAYSQAVAESVRTFTAQLGTLLGTLTGGSPYNPASSYVLDDQVIFGNSVYKATGAVPAGLSPMGIGDGSAQDQQLLVNSASDGFAAYAVTTGGLGGTVRTVTTNADDSAGTTAGSLRFHLLAHRTAWLADKNAKSWIVFNPTFNDGTNGVGKYRISLAADLNTELVSGNLTIDGRGSDVVISGGSGFTGCTASGKPGPVPYGSTTTTYAAGATVITLSTMQTSSTPLAVGYKIDLYRASDNTLAVGSATVTAFDVTAKTITIAAPGLTSATNGTTYTAVPTGYKAGVLGRTLYFGGRLYTDFTAGGNSTPATNIIVSNIALLNNWGGDAWNSGSRADVQVKFWTKGVVFDHCTFTNPSVFHDALLDTGYGATDITVRWCYLHDHYKSSQWWGNTDGIGTPYGTGLPPAYAGATVPAGYSDLGGYRVWNPLGVTSHGNSTGVPMVVTRGTWHHNYLQNIVLRGPKFDSYSYGHVYNNVCQNWGSGLDANGFTAFGAGVTPTGGTQMQSLNSAQLRVDNSIFTATTGATGSALYALKNQVTSSAKGYMKTTGMILNNGALYDGDFNPNLVFDPTTYYSYTPDPVDTTARRSALTSAVTAGAGAFTQSAMWTYVSAAAVTTAVVTEGPSGALGAGGTAALAQKLILTGTGISSATYNSGTRATTYTIPSGTADPSLFTKSGTKATRLAASPANGWTWYESDTGDEYVYVSGAWVLVNQMVLPGREIASYAFWPTSSSPNASTTSTTMVDLASAAVTAGWTGITSTSFDLAFSWPNTGFVVYRWSMNAQTLTSAAAHQWGLYNVGASAAVTNSDQLVTAVTSQTRATYEKRLAAGDVGSPAVGATVTLRPQVRIGAAGTATYYNGATKGPLRIQVFAAL